MDIDVVIIGLNTAATLDACIDSVVNSRYAGGSLHVFYVDGGSNDGSPEIARRHPGVTVIELNLDEPTPGRGRNAGWRAGTSPLVQFLDSDTFLHPDWLAQAAPVIAGEVIAVNGHLSERHPEASVYNWIGSLEWNAPAGECQAFGGNVLVTRSALEASGGYDNDLVGGEDPELSLRMRQQGGKVFRLAAPMATHDLAMTRLKQYVKRAYRTGYGFAAVTARHGLATRGFWVYESARILVRAGGCLGLGVLGLLLAGLLHPAWLALLVPAILLLLYPRLFRIRHFMEEKGIPAAPARIYAWHCSLVVLPELFGIIRFVLGALVGRPLRNRRPAARPASGGVRNLAAVIALLSLGGLAGCQTPQPAPMTPAEAAIHKTFVPQHKKDERFATSDELHAFSEAVPKIYRLGPGDVLELRVWNHADLNNAAMVVAPDGSVTVFRIGLVNVRNRVLDDVTAEVTTRLSHFYEKPEVNLAVKTYANNKAFVLGRVANPGVVNFSGDGTLIEALSLSGGLPVIDTGAFLSKCAIIRGTADPLWVDLRKLLQGGDMTFNVRLQNNDIVFIPESEDETVYVLGEVLRPGPVKLKSQLTLLDVLTACGGPSKYANREKIFIIRSDGKTGVLKTIDLKKMLSTGDLSQDYILRHGDIVYATPTRISQFNDVLQSLTPALQFLNLSAQSLEQFGVMAELRKQIWGQQGFVNSNSGSGATGN